MPDNEKNVPPLIECENLDKAYYLGKEELLVLKQVNLKIYKGEYMSIMGSSGSGKSTLMNIIGFLDRPTRGVYRLNCKDVTNLSDDEESIIRGREIGFVYQTFNLLPRNTAYENVALPLFYQNRPADKNLIMQALETVGIADRARHRPNELSGGQRQRVAIARALVASPSLILADEPTGALDSRTSEEIMELFTRLNDKGVTVIIVTHDPEVAHKTRRVVRIKDGRITE